MKKLSLNKKFAAVLLSLVGALILFFILMFIQNSIINPGGKEKVYYAVRNIDKNTLITTANINSYFVLKDTSKDTLIQDAVSNMDVLKGKYVTNDILKGQQISKDNLQSSRKRIDKIKNLRECSFKVDDLSEADGGTLRSGDVIDLTLTEKNSNNVTTTSKIKSVEVSKAIAQDGTILNRSSKQSATVLCLYLSAQDAVTLNNAVKAGNVTAMKVLDNSNYNDITIQSQAQN